MNEKTSTYGKTIVNGKPHIYLSDARIGISISIDGATIIGDVDEVYGTCNLICGNVNGKVQGDENRIYEHSNEACRLRASANLIAKELFECESQNKSCAELEMAMHARSMHARFIHEMKRKIEEYKAIKNF